MIRCVACFSAMLLLVQPLRLHAQQVQKGEMAGYLLVPNEKVPATYGAGFSMYIAAWPLLKQYPGQRFQSGLATPYAPEPKTFGYRWSSEWTKRVEGETGDLVVLPEFFRLDRDANEKQVWIPVAADEVPLETGLADVRFQKAQEDPPKVYETPEDADSSWKKPGPVAGPFTVTLGDGSLVNYSWYRFADQPALFHADLSDQEREEMQRRVELLHRYWTRDRQYLTPPENGQLADLDPGLIVTPPSGLEVGYVPIVTRQEPAKN